MSGTVSSGKKAAQTIIKRHGKDYYSKIGRKGGKRSTTGGFASQKVGKDGLTGLERARLAGAKGGRKSKRKPASIRELEKRIKEDSKLATVLQDYLSQKKTINKLTKDMYE